MHDEHTADCLGKWTIREDPLTNKDAKYYVVQCRGECQELAKDETE